MPSSLKCIGFQVCRKGAYSSSAQDQPALSCSCSQSYIATPYTPVLYPAGWSQ